MAKYNTLKDHQREQQLYQRRVYEALIIVFLFLTILFARLAYLQIILHDSYQTQSDNNRVSIKAIAPTRGLIVDRNHHLLADNIPSYDLEMVPEQTPNIKQTLDELGQIVQITETDRKRFKTALKHHRRFENVPIRFKLTEKELANFAVNRHRFPSVDIAAGLIRHYPYQADTAHILGYVGHLGDVDLAHIDLQNYSGTQTIGKIGLEKFYETTLHGTVGNQQVETNARGRIVRVLNKIPAISGKTLQLSLDIQLQQVAMQALSGKRGVAIVIDPNNGELLAMASQPSYDANRFVLGIDNKSYQALQQNADNPLFNRAIRGQYPPGSTIKPFLALQALEKKAIAPDFKLFDPGWYQLKNDDHKYRDWRRSGHGWINLKRALQESCSTFFYYVGHQLGIDAMSDILRQFGFGQKTGVDVASETSGLVASTQWKAKRYGKPWYPGETLISGIGQGYTLVTPIQLAKAVAILANQGKQIIPHFLHKPRDISEYHATGPHTAVQFQQPGVWAYVQDAMTGVTHNPSGTAYRSFHGSQYQLAGKTGTAQVSSIKQGERYNEHKIAKKLRDHSLFIGYAPIQHPKIAIAVIIENEKGAAKIARTVLDAYFAKQSTNSEATVHAR